MGEAGGTQQLPWRHPKARFFGAPPRFFAQEQRNGVEQAVGATNYLPRKRRTRKRRKLGIRLSLRLCVCADTLGGGRYPVLPFDPISLVLAQRNGVEPPKKSAFLPRWLHHSRERYRSVDGTFLARLGGGAGACRGVSTAGQARASTFMRALHAGAKKAPSGRTGLLSIKGRPWPSRTGR